MLAESPPAWQEELCRCTASGVTGTPDGGMPDEQAQMG